MSSKPKICLIYTGGTIGMTEKDGVIKPPDNPIDFLRVAPELEDIVEFDFVGLLNKDSTDMNPSDWIKMAQAVYKRRNANYVGYVIAHGTDTMHFSSSALAFAFGPNLNFPIVFTGAQTIPAIKHGDARINLVRACKVAIEDLAEVVICFGDYIFRGCRAQKKDEKWFDAFESPGYYPIGHIGESIELAPIAIRKPERPGFIEFKPVYAKGIFFVNLVPGLEPKFIYPIVDLDECNGIILQSFGAGNVPHEDEYSFIPLIEKATKLNKPVVIASQFPGHPTYGTRYEAGKAAYDAGAIPTGNMTSAAAVVKFRWALAMIMKDIEAGNIEKSEIVGEVKRIMNTKYVGEMD